MILDNTKKLYIANELLKIARELVAIPTGTQKDFNSFNKAYLEQNGVRADSSIWKILKTKEAVEGFLKDKKKKNPKLSEFISKDKLSELLEKGFFTICSAGLSNEEEAEIQSVCLNKSKKLIDENKYRSLKTTRIKKRQKQLRNFLNQLRVPYYEVIGQYPIGKEKQMAELSYIVDLTDFGQNDDKKARDLMKKISDFCGEKGKQQAVIEGIGGERVWVFCKDRSYSKRIGDGEVGGSTVRHQKEDFKDITTWRDEFDLENPVNPS